MQVKVRKYQLRWSLSRLLSETLTLFQERIIIDVIDLISFSWPVSRKRTDLVVILWKFQSLQIFSIVNRVSQNIRTHFVGVLSSTPTPELRLLPLGFSQYKKTVSQEGEKYSSICHHLTLIVCRMPSQYQLNFRSSWRKEPFSDEFQWAIVKSFGFSLFYQLTKVWVPLRPVNQRLPMVRFRRFSWLVWLRICNESDPNCSSRAPGRTSFVINIFALHDDNLLFGLRLNIS